MTHPTLDLDTLAITKELISRKSVTPIDAGCQAFIAEYLGLLGFETEHMDFEDTQNIWTTKGSDKGPCFVFAGHTDVVPPGNIEKWNSNPFEPTEVDGYLFGRGAADMKASLAAMLTATKKFVEQYPNHTGKIGFLITSDEEGPFINGTTRVVDELIRRKQSVDYCIVGEPSSTALVGDVIKIGRRGSLTAWAKVFGEQGHVAYPHLAKNAIHIASNIINTLTNIEWDQGNAHFPKTSMQITNVSSGEAGNIIPGEAQFEFNFRFSTERTHKDLRTQVESVFSQHVDNFNLDWKLNGEPFLTQSNELIDAVSESIKLRTGLDTSAETSGGTSDGRFIAKMGAQIVELGPVNKTIHQINECVKISDILILSDIYFDILKSILTDE